MLQGHRLSACVLVLALSGSLAASAQTAAAPPPKLPVFTTQTSLVAVPTLVTTRKGDPVFTLKAADFAVTDDGVPQQVVLEEDGSNQPVSLAVVVQTGGAGARELINEYPLATMIDAMLGAVEHRVAVVAFDSSPQLLQNFTPSLANTVFTLHNFEPGDGGAAVLDTVEFAEDILRREPLQNRRVILLVSDKIDHGSHAGLEEALAAISDANTTIYSITFSTTGYDAKTEAAHIWRDDTPGPPGGCMAVDPNNPDRNRGAQAFDCAGLLAPPLRLIKIATMAAANSLRQNIPETAAKLTGGQSWSFHDGRSMQADLTALMRQMHNQYLLSFHPASPHVGLHVIEVKLPRYPDLNVCARANYSVDVPKPAPQP